MNLTYLNERIFFQYKEILLFSLYITHFLKKNKNMIYE